MADFDFLSGDVLRIVVLAGGDSAEREISLQSGATATEALKSRGHEVVQVDPASEDLATRDWSDCDVAFIALHGTYGEDGGVQRLLEELEVPYTGSDSSASRLAFSKSAAKERFLLSGVDTPAYVLIHETDDATSIHQKANSIGYPLVVKPDAQGSSLGVTIVRSPEDLPQALARCFHYDCFGLMEQAIEGTEWTMGIANGEPLPLIQIESEREFYDYDAKYVDDETRFLFEFDLESPTIGQIEQLALASFDSLGVSGIARADIRLDRFGKPWILEVNTIPGFTSHSLIPMAAEQQGIELGEFFERTVRAALQNSFLRRQN
ncbi:D-alanine--D-alanine ligase Ddl [Polystyrenella longa]|uniref:D-alanine--D-alanine ligase n=1 Tax=Polystyrenella longa TaxID=2528007 RepID=A0A518CS00_9PLAN|nr:D-alanine--D-alanine ligase [Polystyrenella longa]QDU82006.1 D-alanine--D-alanine ligase Ddl [Polystyrenella longa]